MWDRLSGPSISFLAVASSAAKSASRIRSFVARPQPRGGSLQRPFRREAPPLAPQWLVSLRRGSVRGGVAAVPSAARLRAHSREIPPGDVSPGRDLLGRPAQGSHGSYASLRKK